MERNPQEIVQTPATTEMTMIVAIRIMAVGMMYLGQRGKKKKKKKKNKKKNSNHRAAACGRDWPGDRNHGLPFR